MHVKVSNSSTDPLTDISDDVEPNVTIPTTNTESVVSNKRKRCENIGDFQWLVNTVHVDDQDHPLYKTAKI